jgi:putative ABC transport system permease protein
VAAKGISTDQSSDGSPAAADRFARWVASWRVALRIARRDARRYRWRSALIVVMVGLPVLLLTSGVTLLATNDISTAESVPMVMGSAQARISGGSNERQVQSPDPLTATPSLAHSAALAVPGFAPGSAWTAAKIGKLTGGRAIRSMDARMRVTLGDRRPTMPVFGIDARDPLARGMTELVSGRWARTTSEIVVTEAGIAKGLPRQGKLLATGSNGKPLPLSVVGVATSQHGGLLVALPDLVTDVADQGVELGFLVGRADPVTWSDVRRMNDYGVLVQSGQVFQSPPSAAEVGPLPGETTMGNPNQSGLDLVLLLAVVGLFIETTLLAGPAFAVSAARQRRSLALAASNGAEARQLRRYVLGQAVVLGVVSAAVAVAAGVLLTLLGLTWWKAGHPDIVTGPFEVSWPRTLGVFVCSVAASMVAALLPARGVSRLDVVSVLAGRSGDHMAHRGLPVVGVVLMVGSGVVIIRSASSGADGSLGLGSTALPVAAGAVGLVFGCLMVVPAVLALVGRMGAPLVLPLRLAARDTARQRGRSTPAVAAIMAAVAVVTALSIGAASDTRQQEDHYKPHRPMGTGAIYFNTVVSNPASVPGPVQQAQEADRPVAQVRAVTDRYAPQLTVDLAGAISGPNVDGEMTNRQAVLSHKISWVALAPRGCAEGELVVPYGGMRGVAGCEMWTSDGTNMIQVGQLASLPAGLPLTASQRAVLSRGGILITDPRFVRDGQVSSVAGIAAQSRPGVFTGGAITQRNHLPAVLVDQRAWAAAFHGQMLGRAWILPGTATKLGWPVRVDHFDLTSPTGTISPEVERAVADRLGDDFSMSVERGFQNPYRTILLILFLVTGSLVLIASLISTALSLAESQNDMATLAAVGATRHTRRGVAASQALVVAACGCLLGVVVGVVPGIAVTWPLTTRFLDPITFRVMTQDPVIVIPWLNLVALCIGVPLLAAGFAWMAVRRHPQMTRRMV